MAAAFVLATTVAFVLVALEHLEVAHRYPAGGGGVSAAVEAFGPRVGVVSGALMVSAYLLTIALSTVTAMRYLATINPFWPDRGLVSSVVAILLVGSLSWSGPRLVARLALVVRPGGGGGARLAVRDGGATAAPAAWSELLARRGPAAHARLDRAGHRLRRRLAGLLGAGVAGPARARRARAPAQGHPHRQRPAGGQRARHGAGLHRGDGRGGDRRQDRAPQRPAGRGGPALRRPGHAAGGGADRRDPAAAGGQAGLHRLLQRLPGHRPARLPAGGGRRGPSPPGSRPAARSSSSPWARSCWCWARAASRTCWPSCSPSACSGRTSSPRSAWTCLRWRERGAGRHVRAGGAGEPDGGGPLGDELVHQVAGHPLRRPHQRGPAAGRLHHPPRAGSARAGSASSRRPRPRPRPPS